MWESLLSKLGIDAFKAGLRLAGKRISRREYAELISEAVRELLKLHPDISAAEARLLAAEALGLPVSSDMLNARQMLKAVKRERKRAGGKKGRKKTPKKGKPRTKKKGRKTTKKKAKRVNKKSPKKTARAGTKPSR